MLNLIKKKVTRLVTNNFETPYMTQYSLSFFPRLRLNIIDDGDFEMHTHPWNFTSIILYGGGTKKLLQREQKHLNLGLSIEFSGISFMH